MHVPYTSLHYMHSDTYPHTCIRTHTHTSIRAYIAHTHAHLQLHVNAPASVHVLVHPPAEKRRMAPSCPFPWAKPTKQVLTELKVDATQGVGDTSLFERRAHYGFNELEKQPGTSVWKLILEQFNDTLVKVR